VHVVIVNYPLPATRVPADFLGEFHALSGWAEAVTRAGAQVTVVQRFHEDGELRRDGVRYLLVRDGAAILPRTWQIPRRAHAAAVGARPDLVHLHGEIFPLQTMALRSRLPPAVPLLLQHHGGGPPSPRARGGLRLALARLGLAAASGFIFTTDELAAPWRAMNIIRPGVPVYQVMEASTPLRPAATPGIALRGAPALLWVGRLHPVKDPLTVLDGFAMALGQLPGAALSMIYGSTELLEAVRERAAQPDLRGRVELIGQVPHAHLPRYYTSADAFVLGSRREALGFALIEALACGLAPAVTDIPAFRAITGEQVGAHWAPGDAAACAEAMVAVAGACREKLRRQAQERFASALSWDAVGRTALAAYNDARRLCASR
jgi:glycosyltransferase involved in cell wall biosynthesis